MTLAKNYQQVLDEWIEINKEQWGTLCEHGAEEGSELNLDYNFSTAEESTARGFAQAYEQRYGHAPEVEFFPDEGPEKPAVWAIMGSTPPTKTTLKFLDGWVEELVRLGAEHDTMFEGWGAYPPGGEEPETFSLGAAFSLDDDESVKRYPNLLHVQVDEDIQPIDRGDKYDDPLSDMLEEEELGTISRAGSKFVTEGEGLKITGFEIVVRVADQSAAEKRVREFMLGLGATDSMTVDQIDEDAVA